MLPLAQNLLIFIVLGAPLSLLLPNFNAIFPLGKSLSLSQQWLSVKGCFSTSLK
jgi:hypothetical protein